MQSPSAVFNIGVNVAKAEIMVASAEGNFVTRKIANQRAALIGFLKLLPAASRIGIESTGSYHELLADLAHQRGFVVYVLNPKDTHHYAKAMGLRGKTDRVDAELIARMVEREHEKLHPWIPPTPQQREIDRLLKRRATLTGLRVSLTLSMTGVRGFGSDLKALRLRFDQLIARIDARVKELVARAKYSHCSGMMTESAATSPFSVRMPSEGGQSMKMKSNLSASGARDLLR